MTCTRCSMILSTRLLTDTRDAPSGASAVFRAALYLSIHLSIYLSAGVRRGRPPRARRRPSTPPSTVAGGGGVRDRAAGCAAAALARVPRSWWRRRACARRRPSDLPSTREMLTISRPPPRRCSAACLLGSATRHFSSALFSPTAGCPVTMVHVFFFFFFFFLHPGRVRVLYTPWAAGSARRSALPRVGSGNARARSVAGHREQR